MQFTSVLLRRYRFLDPKSKKARNRSIGQFVKFFIAWNGIGYLIYLRLKENARQKYPDFDTLPSSK